MLICIYVTDIIDFKVSQVSMKLVIALCSKCLYHFVANLLTKHSHKILCKSADVCGNKYFGAFLMTHSAYVILTMSPANINLQRQDAHLGALQILTQASGKNQKSVALKS